MTSSGVAISCKAPLENARPTTAITIPLTSANQMEVCTVSDIFSFCCEAKNLAARTLVPCDTPINRLINTAISAVVDPTAASAVGPLKRPTTIRSTALNIS